MTAVDRIRKFSVVFLAAIPFLLTGCATSTAKTYLLKTPMPTPFRVPPAQLPPAEALKVYEEHRGYVNNHGVQIGHRHFNVERLPNYFRESQFDALGLRTDRAFWAGELKELERKRGFLGGGAPALAGGGPEVLAVLAIAIVLEVVVDSIVNAHQDKKILDLRIKAAGSTETLKDVMTSYNQQLADSLGLRVRDVSSSPVKPMPVSMPATVALGANSTEKDWLEDYQFRKQAGHWQFGFQHSKPTEIFNQFQPEAGPDPFKMSGQVLPYIGLAFDVLGFVAIALGTSSHHDPKDRRATTYNVNWGAIAGGAALASVGFTCQWYAVKLENETMERFNAKMKSKLFPPVAAPGGSFQ